MMEYLYVAVTMEYNAESSDMKAELLACPPYSLACVRMCGIGACLEDLLSSQKVIKNRSFSGYISAEMFVGCPLSLMQAL